MKIQASRLSTIKPAVSRGEAPVSSSQIFDKVEKGWRNDNLHGLAGRAIYGAVLYGIPALAGATMGNAGILPGTLIGAGVGAATHLSDAKDAAIFAVTGAVVGGGLSWAASQFCCCCPAWVPVVAGAALGAGTQALFSHLHENQEA